MSVDADGPSLDRTLRELSAQDASGRIVVSGTDGDHGWVWLRDGMVAGASGPGPKPLLANRVRTYGLLNSKKLRKNLTAATTEPGMLLMDALLANEAIPESFALEFLEQVAAEQLAFILTIGTSRIRFENGIVKPAGPLLVATHRVLDAALDSRLSSDVISDDQRPIATETTSQDPVALAVQQACDGTRGVRALAHECGLTINETIVIAEALLGSGDVTTEEPAEPWEETSSLPEPADDLNETATPPGESGEALIGAESGLGEQRGFKEAQDTPTETLENERVEDNAEETQSEAQDMTEEARTEQTLLEPGTARPPAPAPSDATTQPQPQVDQSEAERSNYVTTEEDEPVPSSIHLPDPRQAGEVPFARQEDVSPNRTEPDPEERDAAPAEVKPLATSVGPKARPPDKFADAAEELARSVSEEATGDEDAPSAPSETPTLAPSERQDVLSNLGDLGMKEEEEAAPDEVPSSSSSSPFASEDVEAVQSDPIPTEYSAKRPRTSPAVTSEVFRELHGLGGEDPVEEAPVEARTKPIKGKKGKDKKGKKPKKKGLFG